MGNTNDKKLKKNEMKIIAQDGYRYDENHLKGVIQNFMEFGFSEEQIVQAWHRTNCRPDLMLSFLSKNQSQLLCQKEEEKMIQQAIELSIKNQNEDFLQDAESYLRTEDPIGLQNIGRTCYFNAFLQTLYHIRELRDPILRLDIPDNGESVSGERSKLNEMLKQFQLTFAAMLKSQKNFTDPTNLFEVLKGLSGQTYIQGEENDFWEFQNSTLEYLEHAFMKESDIDTADLFKSYLRLQNNSSQMFANSILAKKSSQFSVNSPQVKKSEQSKMESSMDEEFVIFDPKRGLSSFIDKQNTFLNQSVSLITEDRVNTNSVSTISAKEDQKSPTEDQQQAGQERMLSLAKQDSNKKKSIKKVKNPITELFFGVGEEKISIQSKDTDVPEVKYHDIPIGIFNLDVKMGDLYTALNSYFKYSVGDYLTEPIDNLTQSTIIKKTKKVDITLSIKTAPKILNFYINRIHYNKEINSAEKSNKKFTFDKEIYIDNYMKGKDQEFEVQKKLIEEIEVELSALEAKLHKFENYHLQEGNNQNSILSALDLVKCYLQNQMQKSDNFIDIEEIIDDIQSDSGSVDVGVIGQKQLISSYIQTLDSYYSKIKQNKNVIEKKIKDLKDKKQLLQNQNKTIKYELFSILIHQGYANTGHYFCYIYDDKKNCWYKFNDSVVTKVKEEEVFRLSYGEQDSNCNACCLFYKNSQTKVNPNKPVEIQARLKAEVQKRDQQFLEKIDEIRIRRKFQEVEQDFNEYIKEIQKAAYLLQQSKSGNNMFTPFLNGSTFKLYLLNSKDEKASGFGKRMILMETLERSDFSDLEQILTKKENLYQGISLFYEHMKGTQGVCGQVLTDQEKKDYLQIEQFYTNLLKYLNCISLIMNENANYPQNFRTLGCLRKMVKSPKFKDYQNNPQLNLLKLSIKYIHEIFFLKSCFMIDKYLHQGQLPHAFTLLNNIVLTYLYFYYEEKPDTDKQKIKDSAANDKNENSMIKSNFESNEINSLISGQIFNNLKQTIQNFGQQFDIDQKSKFDGQLSFMQNPERFPQNKQKIVTAFDEIEFDTEVNIHTSEIAFRVHDQYEIFTKRSEVWIKQLQHLREKRTYIPQEERLNQEELLYFE